MRNARRINRIATASGLFLTIVCVTSCGDKETGPKREDHKAAHTPRYHPDITREAAATGTATQQAAEVIVPSELPTGYTGTPVLFVNSQPITVSDVLEPLMPEILKMAGAATSEREYYRGISRLIADQIRYQSSTIVVYEQAKKKLNETVEQLLDKEAEKAIQRTINTNYGGVRARYEAQLKALGLEMKDVKERIKRQLLVSSFLEERFSPMVAVPPRRDLLKYYQAHLDAFTTPAKAELLMIEIPLRELLRKPVSQASESEIAEAREAARRELRRAAEELESGVDFAAVARRYSKGAQRAKGGSWGEITPGSLTGSWAKAAEILFTLEEGRFSEIIETEESSFIVKCGRKTPQERLTFEEAQARIIDQIREQEYSRMSSRYMGQLLDKAGIDPQQQQEFFIAVVSAAPRPNVK
ncbi:MAG TPA: peptidyl-prolyl cis-trans isomerase [Phycisphaerae bacterium]|nr:peptidyl-prolyl cis-trans isomerase [Phycisphaerae bacterium]HRR83485.1 peptidyl-prolyl cis-trans isomerase [Phycisphaerae bacterium]